MKIQVLEFPSEMKFVLLFGFMAIQVTVEKFLLLDVKEEKGLRDDQRVEKFNTVKINGMDVATKLFKR